MPCNHADSSFYTAAVKSKEDKDNKTIKLFKFKATVYHCIRSN